VEDAAHASQLLAHVEAVDGRAARGGDQLHAEQARVGDLREGLADAGEFLGGERVAGHAL
jgi:hypothetical protein